MLFKHFRCTFSAKVYDPIAIRAKKGTFYAFKRFMQLLHYAVLNCLTGYRYVHVFALMCTLTYILRFSAHFKCLTTYRFGTFVHFCIIMCILCTFVPYRYAGRQFKMAIFALKRTTVHINVQNGAKPVTGKAD